MRITRFAHLLGFECSRTVVRLEEKGILPPPKRDAAGQRRYLPEDVEAARRIVLQGTERPA